MNTLCHDVIASIREYAPVLGLTCKTFHKPCQLDICDYLTVEGMTWALRSGYKPTRHTFRLLLQHGAPLDVIKTIDWTYVRIHKDALCEGAAVEGRLDVLKWARARGGAWMHKSMCALAAERGHLHVLEWARKNGCPGVKGAKRMRPWDISICAHAATGGQIEVLKWARKNGCSWDSRTRKAAEWHGHHEVWKWAQDNGCP